MTIAKSTNTCGSALHDAATARHGMRWSMSETPRATARMAAPSVAADAPATHSWWFHSPASSCHRQNNASQPASQGSTCFFTPCSLPGPRAVQRGCLLAHLHAGLRPLELDRPRGLLARDVRFPLALEERQDRAPRGCLQHHRRGDVPGEERRDDEDPSRPVLDVLAPLEQADGRESGPGGQRPEDADDAEVRLEESAEHAGERDRAERDEPEAERVVHRRAGRERA